MSAETGIFFNGSCRCRAYEGEVRLSLLEHSFRSTWTVIVWLGVDDLGLVLRYAAERCPLWLHQYTHIIELTK